MSTGRSQRADRAIEEQLSLSLIGTSPHYIAGTDLRDFTKSPSYVLQVLTTAVLNAATEYNVEGDDLRGVSLEPGYYHFVATKVQLDSGTALVHRTHL